MPEVPDSWDDDDCEGSATPNTIVESLQFEARRISARKVRAMRVLKYLIPFVVLLTAGLGLWRFLSRNEVHFSQREPRVSAEFFVSNPGPVIYDLGPESRINVAGYIEVLRRQLLYPEVMTAVLRDPGVAAMDWVRNESDPEQALKEAIRTRSTGGFLTIWVEGPSGEDAVTITSAVAEAFKSQVIDHDRQHEEVRLDKLRNVKLRLDSELKQKRNQLQQIDRDVADRQAVAADRETRIKQKLEKFETVIADLEVKLLESRVNLKLLETAAKEEAGDSPEIKALREEILRMETLRQAFAKQIEELDVQRRELTTRWVDREILAEQVEQLKEENSELEQRIKRTEIEHQNSGPPVRLARKPQVPKEPGY